MKSTPIRLSKTRFTAGLQCHKQLWWRVHDHGSEELEADPELQARFDQGTRVGELARAHVPGGVLIDLPRDAYDEKVAATQEAIRSGAKVIYEASFNAGGVFAAVDILQKTPRGWRVIEVKSTTKVKEQHLPDLAVQVHILRKAGLRVIAAEMMVLNWECRFPDLSNLFTRENVTKEVERLIPDIPRAIRAQQQMLAGPLPRVAFGDHCTKPYDCPFLDRCAPTLPKHHVTTLYRITGKQQAAFAEAGYETISDLPSDFSLKVIQERQRSAVRSRRLVVESGLTTALAVLKPPIAFLDFETVAPAIPVWDGCRPYDCVPVQFSCHGHGTDGKPRHFEWIANGPQDPRPEIADALLEATEGAECVLAYNADFEKKCIEGMADVLPKRARALRRVASRLRDLLPVVRDNVHHPDFGGSFSLKAVLPALVPTFTYADLAIGGGQLASVELARLIFRGDAMTYQERETLRGHLLKYCKQDTWGMVKLVERLRAAASAPASRSTQRGGSSRTGGNAAI